MAEKPTYEDLKQRIKVLEKESLEQKRVEEDLKHQRKRLKSLIEYSSLAIVTLDEKHNIISCNRDFQKLFYFSESETIGLDLDALITDQEYIEEARSYTKQTLKGKAIYGSGERRRKDGAHIDVSFIGVPVIIDGRVIGAYGIYQDISERKQADEALKKRAEQFLALHETSIEITKPHNLPELLEKIVERATYLLEGTGGGMYLCDPDKKEVRCVVSYKTLDDYTGTVLKYGEGAAGVVAQTKEPLIIDDYRTWSNRAPIYEKKQPFTAVISVPMIWQDDVIGIIHVLHEMETRQFALSDLDLLSLFASQATIAVNTARLVGEVQSHAAELEKRLAELEKEIKERKRAEEKAWESEQRYRAIFDQAADSIVLVEGETGFLVEFNEMAHKSLGYTRDEFKKLKIPDFEFLESNEEVIEHIKKIFKEGAGSFETKHKTKEGGIRDIHVSSRAISIHGKDFIQSMWCDITDRKHMEESLRYSKERYQALSDATFESVFISEKGICTDTNKRATEMFGYNYDEFIGMSATGLADPEYKELVKHNILSGYGEPYEAIVQRKDGSAFHAEIRGKMAKYQDKKVRVTVLRDIDARKRAEEILHKTHDELEKKVRERTTELEKSKSKLIKEIEGHKKTEEKLRKRENDLESKTNDLEELNAALKVLLNKREEDKTELQDNILSNVKTLIQPYVYKLKQFRLPDGQKTLLDILESNLNEIVSPFTRKLSSKLLNLSPTEIQVANLVKYGKTNKEIAEMSHVTKRTIAFHRENIRKKLGIKNHKTNLKTYLMSLD